MKIAIASGKGGTGKTTIAVNLAMVSEHPLIDCDTEEPNCHIFFPEEMKEVDAVSIPVPRIDQEKCTNCGKCSKFCRYNALFQSKDRVLVFDNLCHGCGGCSIVCPEEAVKEEPRRIGIIRRLQRDNIKVMDGVLDISQPSGVPIIKQLKRMTGDEKDIIMDCPPGTSCSAVESIRGADICLLVTEPTPFGLHDLKASIEMVRSMDIVPAVVINRDGLGDGDTERYCIDNGIPIVGRIPNDLEIARIYSEGGVIAHELPDYRTAFEDILEKLKELVS